VLRLLRLFGALFSMSLRRQLAFRADLVFELLLTVVALVSSVAALGMVYSRTSTLGGWHAGQAVALLGTFQIVSGLRAAFVEPNIQWLDEQVRDGRFDPMLVQPAPTIFLASLSSCSPLALAEVILGFGVVFVGVRQSAETPSVMAIVIWLVLLLAATAIMWASRVLVAAVVFWALALTLDVVYDSIWQFARYPVDVYRRPLRLAMTYVLPIAVLSSIPASTLVRNANALAIPVVGGIAVAACVLAQQVWRLGLRRYTSATS